MYSPRALPSSVSNVTEYGNSESPVATILKTASDPSVTVWVDGSRLMTIPSRHKISYPSSIAQMMWLTIIVYDSDRSHTISHFQSGLRSDGERERKQFSQLLDNVIVEDGNADCCLLLIWPNREWVWSTSEVGGSWKCYVVFAGERGKLLPVYLLCQLMQLLFLLQELEISQTFELLPVQHQPTRLLHIQGG